MTSFSVPTLDFTRYELPLRAFIGGEYVESSGGDEKTLVSSVNDEIVTSKLQWSTAEDVDIAVSAAETGLLKWQSMDTHERRNALVRFGELIGEHRERLHWLEAILVGKDTAFFNFEINAAVSAFTYFGNYIDKFPSEVLDSKDSSMIFTLRQPYGITAGIVPFNGPVVTFAAKVAPALAAGNAIIIKTSELNPLSTLFMASLSVQAGIPAGALNVLTGGGDIGHALASHSKIRKISFTGSIGVGKLVQEAAAQSNLKSVTLELGGKSPLIIFPDVDIDKAAQASCQFVYLNGQGCALTTRLYVHQDIAEELMAKLKGFVEGHAQTLGADPLAPDTFSSPLYHHRQKEVVLSYLESGKKQATLLTGGEAVGDKGCYIQPTIFSDPEPNARILKEEIFGPVLVVCRFRTEEEVSALANDTEFGLLAAVWTKDAGRALRCARKLEAGSISINGHGEFNAAYPTGAWKQSGQGLENGKEAMLDWTQSKTLAFGG